MSQKADKPAPDAPTLDPLWMIWRNPLVIRSVRSRLRPRAIVPRVVLIAVISGFLFMFGYTITASRGQVESQQAAEVAIIGLVPLQMVLLMLMGTGAVASGVAEERDKRLLDYQRMTPMPALHKVVGYLLGLPIREYAMFAATLPFVMAAVAMSGMPLSKPLQFYAVFFTSVMLYHSTGMVAGMIAEKPRRAGLIAQGIVVVLYLVLPRFSSLGVRFLEFLTVWPILTELAYEELPEAYRGLTMNENATFIHLMDSVRFFTLELPGVLFALLLQGLLIVVNFSIVLRKWRDESLHVFSKTTGLGLYLVIQVLLVGCIWPFVADLEQFRQLYWFKEYETSSVVMLRLMWAILAIDIVLAVVLLAMMTPTQEGLLRALRRARKLGHRSLGLLNDGANSLPQACAFAFIAAAGAFVLLDLAEQMQRFGIVGPDMQGKLLLVIWLVTLILAMQALLQWLELARFMFAAFFWWVVPLMVTAILWAIGSSYMVPAFYVGSPSPILGIWIASRYELMPEVARLVLLPELGLHTTNLMLVAIASHVVLGLVGYIKSYQKTKQARQKLLEVGKANAGGV